MCAKLEKKNQFSDWNHLYEQCFTDCSLFQECSDDWLNWRAQPGFFCEQCCCFSIGSIQCIYPSTNVNLTCSFQSSSLTTCMMTWTVLQTLLQTACSVAWLMEEFDQIHCGKRYTYFFFDCFLVPNICQPLLVGKKTSLIVDSISLFQSVPLAVWSQ